MQQFVCLPYQLMRSAVGVIVVLAQLQNHCRSRETCSFGTPDAVVCRAARSASAALAAVGPSVGIGSASRIGVSVCMYVCMYAWPSCNASERHGTALHSKQPRVARQVDLDRPWSEVSCGYPFEPI